MSEPVRGRRLLAVAVVAILWALLPGVSTPAEAQTGDDGVRIESISRYVVDPAAGAVHASVDVTLTNTTPDRSTQGGVIQTFIHRMTVPVLAEATNVVATKSDGRSLGVDIEPTQQELVSLASVDLAPDVFYRQSQSFTLTFDLLGQPPRSPLLTRVNAGFLYVVPIPLGDSGLASIEVTVPDGYDVGAEGTSGSLERTVSDGQVIFTATAIDDPDGWNQIVVGRNDDALVSTKFEAAEHEIEVRAWPDDGEWAAFVESQVREGLPVLQELIGRPPPRERRLSIVETVAPYVYGYAGWYTTSSNTIEIGDELDDHTIFHEISHVWFNGDLVVGRWVAEACAEEYAARTVERMAGPDAPEPPRLPDPIDPAHPGALPLNQWSNPQLFDELTEQQEQYAYNASWALLRAISDEVGIDALGEVTEAMLDRTIAYRGDPDVEGWRGRTDWRRFLDLLQEVAGSASAEGLFTSHVVTPEEATVLTERTAARQELDALETAGTGWSPPLAVRVAMGRWDFADAQALMTQSQGVLEIRAEVAEALQRVEVDVPTAFEAAYEGAEDLDDLAVAAGRFLGGSRAVAAADAAVDEDDGIWGAIGLLGSDPEGKVERAVDRLVAGDVGGAVELAEDANALVGDAEREGQKRVAAAGGGVAAIAAGLFGVRSLRRRRRQRRAASAQQLVADEAQLIRDWAPQTPADPVEQ